jgi:S1-C subfamily serine protease
MASGSGILITPDGYIATNNHVIENASDIKVILPDKREFSAELIGRDPNTDLALLKIKAEGLPIVKLGNSDNVQVGEWVLAGYPFSLNTTVTAGIISAKARSIGIINRPGTNNSKVTPLQARILQLNLYSN